MSRMKLLTTTQLAKVLGVGRATIYRWLDAGSIQASATAGDQPVWTEGDVRRVRKWMRDNYMPQRRHRKGE